jgi:hypothetical protein
MEMWIKSKIFEETKLQSLIAEIKLNYLQAEEQRKSQAISQSKKKASSSGQARITYPEVTKDDFRYLLFSHPLGDEGQVHLAKPWFNLSEQLDLAAKQKLKVQRLSQNLDKLAADPLATNVDLAEFECKIAEYRIDVETSEVCITKLLQAYAESGIAKQQENNLIQNLILLNNCDEVAARLNKLKARFRVV